MWTIYVCQNFFNGLTINTKLFKLDLIQKAPLENFDMLNKSFELPPPRLPRFSCLYLIVSSHVTILLFAVVLHRSRVLAIEVPIVISVQRILRDREDLLLLVPALTSVSARLPLSWMIMRVNRVVTRLNTVQSR